MDDTFGFVAPVMPRRAVHPLALRAGVIAMVFVATAGALGVFVVSQERAADERRAVLAEQVAAQQAAQAAETAVTVVADDDPIEMAARTSAGSALALALAVPDLADAGPAALAAGRSNLTFVDGPSTAPSVVSVAATEDAWAAAVMGAEGCVWIRLDASGAIARAHGEVCIGTAALETPATGTW
jgi:hypothetical protein